MDNLPQGHPARTIAQEVADAYGAHPEVLAIELSGALATAIAESSSDLDPQRTR